jgi:hypothetical protein
MTSGGWVHHTAAEPEPVSGGSLMVYLTVRNRNITRLFNAMLLLPSATDTLKG